MYVYVCMYALLYISLKIQVTKVKAESSPAPLAQEHPIPFLQLFRCEMSLDDKEAAIRETASAALPVCCHGDRPHSGVALAVSVDFLQRAERRTTVIKLKNEVRSSQSQLFSQRHLLWLNTSFVRVNRELTFQS